MRVLDVADLTAYIKDLLDSDPILSDVWVRGEVSNFVRSAAGHIYFTLKSERAQLRCVLFRGQARWLTFQPDNGDAILAHGRVSVYEASGQYQLYVDLIQPEGTGLLQLQFEELRHRLEQEGLFDPARKRPLPRCPRRIGVVTSPTGAVWHDIQTVLRRRYPLAELVLAPAQVQGEDAPPTIIRALHALQLQGNIDVIIVARGGGSMEDLWCFNDERVARAVFASPIPVISAVGHETDYTICDFVADLRAPTPSAAAELVAPHIGELAAEVASLCARAETALTAMLRARRETVGGLALRLQRHGPENLIRQERLRLDGRTELMRQRLLGRIAAERAAIEATRRQLDLLHPLGVMRRGYAIVVDPATGQRRRRALDLAPGQQVTLEFYDGDADAIVRAVTPSSRGAVYVHTPR
ncbi:MAG: exodeoxyribonuclease VII large subunit [Sphaerobacter sp.]|nr:exodeoxyribonuclease VII large subunit [Sphaerobacter sp.]